MPGILGHLLDANYCNQFKEEGKIQFLAGNLVPDMVKEKSRVHFYKQSHLPQFSIPDIDEVWKLLYPRISEPIILGLYNHLYLDHEFIGKLLIPSFEKAMKRGMTENEFFSDFGLYGTYTQLNIGLIEHHISLKMIEGIPAELPKTGIAIFDERREQTWKDEFDGYLAQVNDLDGVELVFSEDEFVSLIEETAQQFKRNIQPYINTK